MQPIAEIMDGEQRDKIVKAFIMNVVVCRMFGSDQTAQFYAAFLGEHRRPVLFFTW